MGDSGDPIVKLLERERECARIEEGLAAAIEGRGSTLLIEGPPGIGKSSLLEHAARCAEGATVLSARPTALERDLPFGVARDLLAPPLMAADEGHRTRLLEGPARHAAAILELEPEPVPGDAPGPGATLYGLWWLVAAIAEEQPLVLIVDDAHWADPDSLRALGFIAPRLAEKPILLLLAARREEWRPEGTLGATASDAPIDAIEPGVLSAAATASMLERVFEQAPGPEFAAACRYATGGNPFYLRALAAELAAKGIEPGDRNAERVHGLTPRSVTRATIQRLGRLSEDALPVARAVAVLGDDADIDLVASLLAIDVARAQRAVEGLTSAAVLARGTPLRFSHPIVGDAVHAATPRPERSELHRRAAALLAERGAPLDRAAVHVAEIAPAGDAEVVAGLRRAAQDALRKGASETAVGYLRRALEEPPPQSEMADLLLELGSAELLVDGSSAITHLNGASEAIEDPVKRSLVAASLARALILQDRIADGAAIAARVAGELGEREPEWRRLLDASVLAASNAEPKLAEERAELVARLRGHADLDAPDVGARALAVGLASMEAHACAPMNDVVPRVEAALEDEVLIAADNGGPHLIAAVLVLVMADSERALDVVGRALELAEQSGDVIARAADEVLRCLSHLARGELEAAVEAGEAGLEMSDLHGIGVGLPWGGWCLSVARLASGDVEGAAAALERAEASGELPQTTIWVPYADARARLSFERGDHRDALEWSLWCGRVLDSLDVTNPSLVPWRSRAALCLSALEEDGARSRELVEREVELARRWGAPRALGAALRAQGVVEGDAEGIERLRESVAVLEGSPAQLELARSLVELGASLRRSGLKREASEHLAEGMDLAWRLGARGLAERARDELRTAGARPRRFMLTGVEALTASERRVADMAAEGLTNREIAQSLHLTLKTVETHLSSAYRKLEIASREELPVALAS